MLPVALTCPLWWVARWASRLLVGLALTAGLTVGVAGPAQSAEAAHATGATAAVAPAAVSAWAGADGATCTGGVGITPAAAVEETSSGCWVVVSPATGLPDGIARPVPVTATETGLRSDRPATVSGPRAPPLA